MKKIKSYQFIWLIIALVVYSGCNFGNIKKLNRRITLWRKDKIPYGTYFSYENMQNIFPRASITINETSPTYEQLETQGDTNNSALISKKAYVVISPQVVPDQTEIDAMMNFVGSGNYIFISSFYIGDSLLTKLKIKTDGGDFYNQRDTLRIKLKDPVGGDMMEFEYPGDSYSAAITSLDSQYVTILGVNESNNANFIKLSYKGGGAIYLHFVPMAFTNFFLLYKNNHKYYENAFSYIPSNITEIKWDDYFRKVRTSNFSSLKFVLSNPSSRWAFWLLLLLFLLIYLFDSKRKQRAIEVIAPLRNSSADFVKTVGRLYYQRRDNINLAHKVVSYFLSYIRTKYNLQTNSLDTDFVERLTYKSGCDKTEVKEIIENIKLTQQQKALSDEGLIALNKKIEAFYKHS
jgi:hypothetical protein